MVICESCMFQFSVSKDMKNQNNNDKTSRGIPTHLLTHLLAQIIKELQISVEHDRAVTTLNIIKH